MSDNSSRSDSNIFNLSSNNSQQFQDSVFQFQEFKNKVRNLLQTNTDNLDELYFIIEQKTRNNFFGQQFKSFDHMLQQLKEIKGNNRSIAKFVSLLSQKINKKCYENKNLQIIQKRQKQYKNEDEHQIETNPTEWSRQYYNYKYKPFPQVLQKKNKDTKEKEQTMTTISNNPSNSYEQYQQRNRLYQEKIRNMLNEVSLIKGHLSSQHSISPIKAKYQYPFKSNTVENIKSQNITKKKENNKNEIPQKLKKQHQQMQIIYKQTQSNMVNNTVTNSLNQINNQENHHLKQRKQASSSQYLQKVNDRNNTLMNYAKKVSQKLQQLKEQTYLIEQQKRLHQERNKRENQIQDNLTTFKALQEAKNEQQQKSNQFQSSVKTEQNNQSQFKELGQDMQKRKNQFTKKKSILDDMKNVQSKVLISQSLIQSQNKNKMQRKSSFQNIIRQETQHQEQGKSKISSQDSGKKIVISYLTMQDKTHKWNQESSNGFRSIPQQNLHRVSSSSGFTGISQPYQTSNSQLFYQKQQTQNFPIAHNTSIMNPVYRKSELIPRSFINNNGVNIQNHVNRNASQMIQNSPYNLNSMVNNNSNIKLTPNSSFMKNSLLKNSMKQSQTNRKSYESRISENNDSFFNPVKYLGIQSNNIRNFQINGQKQLNSSRQNNSIIQASFVNQTTIRPRKSSQNIICHEKNNSNINLSGINRFQPQIQNKSNSLLKNNNSTLNHSSSLNNIVYVRPAISNGSLIGVPPRSSYIIPKSQYPGQRNIELGRNKRQSEISFGNMSTVQPFKELNNSVRSSSRLSQNSQKSGKSKSKGLQIYSNQK